MPDNPLEAFLDAQEEEGRAESEGTFTISRDQALAKLTSYQLPFGGAWALKLIQAAVAGGAAEITIRLDRADSRFYFRSGMEWTTSQVESALFDPNPGPDEALNHLVTALRVVGFSEKRAFRLCLPGKNRSLEWDGAEFKDDEPSDVLHFVLNVSNRAADDRPGFLGLNTINTVSRRHADVTRVLAERCHVSPVPLILDGRRIDAIELSPEHGWGPNSQLLIMGFEDGDSPSFKLPAATRNKLATPKVVVEQSLLAASAGGNQLREQRDRCSLAFLVCAHMKRVKKGKSHVWRETAGRSRCYWVKDGVLLNSEPLVRQETFCSVGCYLSAQGLSTDLTGLGLRDTEEKRLRLDAGRRMLREGMEAMPDLDFATAHRKARENNQSAGAVIMGFGLLFTLMTGAGGLLVALMGGAVYMCGTTELTKRESKIVDSLEWLKRNL